MEEQVGEVWHKFITKKANRDFTHATVTLQDVNKEVGVIFRALGGNPAFRIDPAQPQKHPTRRSFLEKIAGSGLKIALAWTDSESIRLPESIAVFEDRVLNKKLYIWLACMCAQQPSNFNHLIRDNSLLTFNVLTALPGLIPVYESLINEHIKDRPCPDTLPTREALHEHSIQRALQLPLQHIKNKEPRSFLEAQLTLLASNTNNGKFQPAHIPLWLYLAPQHLVNRTDNQRSDSDPEEDGNSDQEKKKVNTKKQRKQSERVEDPDGKNGLIAFRLESLFTWSEFANVDRTTDESKDDDIERVAEDLDIISVSKQAGTKGSMLKFDLDLPSANVDDIPLGTGILQPEWNYKKQQLQQDQCRVIPMLSRDAGKGELPLHLKSSARKVRAQFESLAPLRSWQRNQSQGDEIDIGAWVNYYCEKNQSQNSDINLYQSFKGIHRDLACLLLADLSLSTDSWINNESRVIDVIRDSLFLFSEALSSSLDKFALYGFSSKKRDHIRFNMIKNFDESYNARVKGRIQAIKPGYYTRMGAAIRQAADVLAEQKSAQRLLLILTDGKPNDLDHYEGRYGIEDTRAAVQEAKKRGLKPFCITIDEKAEDYLPYIYGSNDYLVIRKPEQLPRELTRLYCQLTQ